MPRLSLCSMAVPWPERPLLGVFHLHQARAAADLGTEMTLLGPAPAVPAWAAWAGRARAHRDRPRRYVAEGVTIDSPRVRFAYGSWVRNALARATPGAVLGWADRAMSSALDAHVAEFRPDALIAHGILPWGRAVARAAERAGIPHAFIEHSAADLLRIIPGTPLGRHATACAQRARRVFVVGPQMLRHARDTLAWDNVELLPNGAITSGAAVPPRPESWSDRFVVLAAANYYRRKGFEELVQALAPVVARHPRVELHLVTSAPTRLSRLVQEVGVAGNVVWHPPLPPAELLRLMAWADLFALPSWDEAFGLVYAEALAAGTPVLASHDSGFAIYASEWERRHGPAAVLVEPRSVESLALGLLEAIEDSARLRNSQASGAAMVAAWFDWRRNAERLIESLLWDPRSTVPGNTDGARPLRSAMAPDRLPERIG